MSKYITSNLYAMLRDNGINMPTEDVFYKNMSDPNYRKTLHKGLEDKGFDLDDIRDFQVHWHNKFANDPNYKAPDIVTSKTVAQQPKQQHIERVETTRSATPKVEQPKPNSKPTTDEDLAKTFVMSPEWQDNYAFKKKAEEGVKADKAKSKQLADAYNAYAKLEDSFAKYEQSQDVSDLFNVGQQEPIIGEDPKKYWRNKVAQRKQGEAQAKAKVDQEREELRQRMQLLKDNPDAYDELFGIKVKETPEVGMNLGNSFSYGKPVDKRGNVHDNWVSRAQANQRIDAEDKALQLGFQQQELQEMLADPMALDKEMSKLKAELAELTKQRDAYGSQFAKEHPWQMMANLMGRDSFDNPYEVGMYGVDAMETQMQMNNVIARINMLTEAKNAFERGSWSGHGFWNNVENIGKGMKQFATEINSYTDKYNIESGMALNNLANKIERGEMLTDEEMSWFVTAKLKEEGEKAASQGPTTGAVGYGAPASLEYMVTMALNPARGASKTISDKIIEAGVRRFGKSAFTKMMAKATGMLTEGAVLSTTLGADNVASDALGRMAGKVGFDDSGNVAVADRVNPLKAMYQSTMASTIESAVEMMGVPIIGKATKGIGKVATKLADAMSYGKVSKLLSAMDKSQIVNWTKGMQKATGWQNLGEEWGEENVTMLANAIIVGDNEIADMFDTRTQLEILGTCALISGAMSTANVAGFATEYHKVNREYKKAKQEVLRQFSSDVWASLDNLITNAQDEDLTVRLADAMDGMAMNREQRSAIMNYLTALKRYQKFNELNDGGKFIIGAPQAQATQSTSTSTYEIDSDITLKDEIGNPIDAHIIGRDANGNYMVESSQPINGKRVQPMSADQLDAMVIPNTPDGIQQSEVDGYNLTDPTQQAEVSMLADNGRDEVATLLGVTPDAVDATLQQVLGDNPTDAKIEARFGNSADVVKGYVHNVAKVKGMTTRVMDDITDAIEESDKAIDAVNNNGNVVTAKDVNGNDVNVISGNIVTFDDGVIDVTNSDASVVIRHADGTTEMVVPTSLTEVVSMPTEQAKATQAQAIAQQMQQAFSDKLNGALDYSQGQQYTMLNADGSTTDVTILADNGDGNVTVTARDGNKEGGVTDGKQIVLPKSQIQQGVREFKRNELRAQKAKQTSVPQAESAPTEVAQPQQADTTPRDEQGNIMYEQMDADSAWDALLAETDGDAEMALVVANEMIADKTKAVEKASKMVAQPGVTPQEKIANLKAVKQAQAQAQAELAKWQEIADVPMRRASLQTEQTDLQTETQGQQVTGKLPASEEVDENGYPFITSSNGTTIFGEITEDTGLPNAPIKLSEGIIDDNGNGYGLAHIDVRHGEQIRNAGFNSVVEFVEYVANNYDKDNIKVGKKRPNGSGTFIIQIEDKHSNLLYIELSRDGSYWNVNSGGIFRKGYAEKKKNVGLNTELSTSPTTEEDKSFVQTEDKGSVSADTHSDNQHLSTDKGSNLSSNNKENSQKVEEEKDVIEELRERLRVGNERDQRAGRPPRPSDYIEAIGKGDDKAMKAWEGEFNGYAQKLNADDLPDIESTIRRMQGHIDTIRSGNPKGYKDNSAYKAYSGIKKMLEKRRRELNKQSAEENTRLSAMSGVGLVEDARTRTLGDKTRKMLDAMAKRLGLQVEFVDEIVTGKDEKGNNTYANADIVGNKVRIAWDKRDQALDFLLGHEFTHRMQNLSPEAYAEFVEATKQALGEEEWNKRIKRMQSLYKQHGIAISEQGVIDEVVADYAGELVEERGVFDNFVERNKSNRGLLSAIADVLRSIKEFFTLGKQRKINNAIARLEALIESASEANVRGDVVSSEEQKNSLIGERGATALDKAEEATHRMDNLAVAREMESNGKDAKAIRMATGWERGADGKWRYEIEDIGEIETPDEAIARMEKERRAIEKDRERLDYVVYQRLPRNATEEQKAKMKELRKRHKELVKKSSELWNAIYDKSNSKLGVHLSEYIGNDNELFKAYPELRNIDVSFVENSAMINEGFNGSFNGHTIWINPYAENARSILIHEIQHAIQNIEGFAKGGNNKTADMLRDKARVWAWRNALVHTAKERPELSGTTAVEKALIEEYKEDGLEDYIPSEEQRIKGLNLYLRGYDNEGYEQAYNQMHKVMPGEDHTTYRRLAGEVESRNAQKRMDMTAEQRRETLLSETEDVAREDQIFLMKNGAQETERKYSLQGNSMTEEEQRIVDEAKANGTYLKAPNGKASNLNERQWIQVRTKAFKDWFGDWELVAKAKMPRVAKSVSEAGELIKPLIGQPITNDMLGMTATISRNSLDKLMSEKATKQSVSPMLHAQAVANIDFLFEKAYFDVQHEDKNGDRNIAMIHRLGSLMYDESSDSYVPVKITVKEFANEENKRIYSVEAIDIETQKKPAGQLVSDSKEKGTTPITDFDAKLIELVDNAKFSHENSSKVVDENGEPMVVDGLYLNLERNPIDDISRKINKATNLVKMIKDAEIQTGTRYRTMDFLYTNQGAEVSDRVFSSPYSDIIEDLYNGTEPEIVVGFRYGKIRDNGKSYNYRDNAFEKGVSIAGRVHELNMQKSSYYEAFFGDAPYNMILGVNLGHTGADGEILLTFAEVIGNAEKSGEIAKSATDNVGKFDASNPDIRYSLQNKYGIKVGENVQVETIRDLFNEWNGNEELSELFDKVYDVASKLTFDIAFDKLEKNALGLYNAAAGLMEFSDELLTDKIKPQRKAQTILHELIHSVTTYAMYIDDYKEMQDVFGDLTPNVKRAVDMLNEVYDEIKNKYRFRGEYGITDSKEMVAELANARFRNKLKDVGLWQKIVDAIKELFGITTDTVTETRFDRVDNALNDLLDNFDRSLWAQTASMGEKIFFDEGNDVRYSLASDMARDAVMTALEGAGIDVEMATPEMVEDVLRARDGVQLSKRSEEREQTNRWIDEATALVSGKSIKEVRQERIRKERERKELAKEIYENVLSGNFNEVTLQKINQYIDETTPRNPYGRRLSQRLPQRVEREMYEKQRENAVDALYSRISESSVPANGRFSESGRREIESRKKEALKGWAIATGNWHTDLSAFTNQTEPIGVGTDSKVYISKDGQHVIKASKGKPYGKRFRPDIDNIPLFNSVFKNSAYEIVGYGEIDGEFVRILKQPIVDFANSTPLTEDERVEYMRSLGFEPLNKENTAFSNGEIVISDLQKSNIVKDKFGEIRVVDADAKLHTKDVGGNYEYLPVEYDLPSAEFHIAYHGSGAKFDEFDHSHMGEGEGAQAYGWGTYLTEVEGIAKGYATTMRDKNISEKHRENAIINNLVRQTLASSNKEEALEYLRNLLNEKWSDKKRVKAQIKIIETGKFLPETKIKAQLYFVEIPDDNGSNYLVYDKEMSKKELNEVRNKLEAILAEGDYKGIEKELKRELDSVFVDGLTASDVYGNVSAYLGGDKQASEFFNEMGYVGIKYPANYRSGGNEDGKKNFVIFNKSDMKITDRVEFLQTPDGTVYGWTIGGKIFLTEQGMNAETPIHEYTHLWANAMRRNNEQGWESVKDLLRGTPMWDEVLADKNYSNIHDNEDLVASEVLSRYSGKENAKRLEDEAQRMIGEAKGIGAKADAVSLIDRVRRALQKFWDWVGKDLFGIKDFNSIEQVTDRVLYDLMNQTNLNAEVSEGEANPIAEKEVENVILNDTDEIRLPRNREEAYNFIPQGGAVFRNNDQNADVRVSRHTIKHSTLHDNTDNYAIFAGIEKIVNEAIKIGDIPVAENEKGKTNSVGIYYIPINVNGSQYSARLVIKELINRDRVLDELSLYNVSMHKEKGSAIQLLNASNEVGSITAKPQSAYKVKDLIHNSQEQDKKLLGISNKTKFSLQGAGSVMDNSIAEYEKRVNTKGKGGALHLSKFNFKEAWQDGERALKEAQRVIEKQYGIQLEDFEDAYKAENALSSVNQAEWERYIKDYYEPMMQIIDKWILKGGETEKSVNHYLIAKSGLERNREFTVRDALAVMDKMDRQIINGAYSGTVLQLANALRQGQISQDEYDAQVQEAKDKKNQALENIKNAQQARVDAYKAERDALREQLKNGDITYKEFNQLSDEVAIRHAKVEEIKDYSGLTALAKQYNEKDWRNFAEQMVINFENKHDNTDVLWERINNATKKAVEKSYESGITSKEAKDHLDQMFLWYVPMGGMENDTAEDIYSYLNRNADSAFTQTVKRAEGHSEHISDDVMALIANTMQSAILQGNRNKMKQKFLNMVQNYPTELFTLDRGWLVLQGKEWVESHPEIKADYTAEQVRDAINAHNEEMRNLEEQGLAMSKEGALKLGIPFKNERNEQEHAIPIMRNGQKVTIYVNGNPRVAQALNGNLKADSALAWYEFYKRWFSAAKTSYSPNFIVTNTQRDTGLTLAMTFKQRGFKEMFKAIRAYAPAYKTLLAHAMGKKTNSKYDQYFDEFVRNGGITGYSTLHSVDEFKTDNAKRMARLKGAMKAIRGGVNTVKAINKALQEVNGIFENVSRFNEYIRSRERGDGVATSVFNAKNITVNFNKKGGGKKTDSLFHQLAYLGRMIIPFFNPTMQGIYQFFKVDNNMQKMRLGIACFTFLGNGFLTPILNAFLVTLLGDGDEDDYMKQPEWVRRNNFMIFTGDGYAKFALPQMFREFYGMGDILYCAIKGNMTAEEAAEAMVGQIANVFSLNGVSTYFDWIRDIAMNTNFMGNPLWKENDFNKYDPEYQKAYNSTWSWLVDFSEKVNKWTGGDEHTASDVSGNWMNPAVWQRIITEIGGGVVETVGDAYNTLHSLVHGDDIDYSNIPLVKRLYAETNDETLQKWIDRQYYAQVENHDKIKDRLGDLRGVGTLDAAEKISDLYNSRDYMNYVIYDITQDEIKDLHDKAKNAPEDKKAEWTKAEYDAKMDVVSMLDTIKAIEDNELGNYMKESPEVAVYVVKDIEKKIGDKYRALKKEIDKYEKRTTGRRNAKKAVKAFKKTPTYKYYETVKEALKIRQEKKKAKMDALPTDRIRIQKEIDSIDKQLVELRKAYESIGEIKE